MSKVIVSLPGLAPAQAKDLVNMALAEWRLRRERGGYVEKRYAEMDAAFRQRRQVRLAHELAALDKCEIDPLPTLNEELP
jgi:hypothetical protein